MQASIIWTVLYYLWNIYMYILILVLTLINPKQGHVALVHLAISILWLSSSVLIGLKLPESRRLNSELTQTQLLLWSCTLYVAQSSFPGRFGSNQCLTYYQCSCTKWYTWLVATLMLMAVTTSLLKVPSPVPTSAPLTIAARPALPPGILHRPSCNYLKSILLRRWTWAGERGLVLQPFCQALNSADRKLSGFGVCN